MNGFLENVKRAALEAVNAAKPFAFVLGKVTSVSLNASNGYGSNAKQNKRYSDKAVKMELTGKTASDIDGVDTVTGATCSSKAIKQAVKQALAKAEG